MSFRTLLKSAAFSLASDIKVTDVRIGLCYCAVELDNKQVGLAYIFRDNLGGGCSVYDTLRPLAGRPARDLLSLFDATGEIESAIALATANALFNTSDKNYISGPAVEQLKLRAEDRVAMIGHFTPLVKEIRQRVAQLNIFEREARPEEEILAIETADELLPQCQVALITSTTIINNSIDALLELAKECREVVMVGSSTPLLSEVLDKTPVTLLSGITIQDGRDILQIVSEGGGTPSFKGFVKKVNLSCT